MYFKQFYLGCLAHASYMIGSDGEAAVVDPQRDVDQYIEEAEKAGMSIKYIIETHLHADFVSGHCELAERTGAEIVLGENAGATFPFVGARDGQEFRIGKVVLKVLQTPGHTPESISVLTTDTEDSDQPQRVLTGDTLFIGDVGRPDLVGARGLTAEHMAGLLYDSLHGKLLTLPDDVEVYPAHGAGSLCGKNLSSETMSTIGQQRKFNVALGPMTRQEFIRMTTTNLPEVPAYFPKDVELNRDGPDPLSDLAEATPFGPMEVQELQRRGHVVLDVRSVEAFGRGHVPGSLHIGRDGQLASWAGTLIPMGTSLIVVADDEEREVADAVTRLARVGFDSVEGYLSGGMKSWTAAHLPVADIPQVRVEELRRRLGSGEDLTVIDVRRPGEYEAENVAGTVNVGLADFREMAARLDRTIPIVVICRSGYRSSVAASIARQAGLSEVSNVTGGLTAWIEAGFPTRRESVPAA